MEARKYLYKLIYEKQMGAGAEEKIPAEVLYKMWATHHSTTQSLK